MDKDIKFDMSQLDRFGRISEPGTYYVRVLSTVKSKHLYSDDGHPRWIVTLRALREIDFILIKAQIDTNNVLYRHISKKFLTGALWENQIYDESELPIKGEEVCCVFNYVDNVLLCTSLNIIPRKRPKQYIHSVEAMKDLEQIGDIFNNLDNG